ICKDEVALVVVQDRIVLDIEGGGPIDGGKVEVQVAVVIIVSRSRAGIRLLVEDPAGTPVSEIIASLRPQVAQKTGLGLVAPAVPMGEVACEQIKLSVVIEIPPASPNGVAAFKTG